jgi:hypothetical protein
VAFSFLICCQRFSFAENAPWINSLAIQVNIDVGVVITRAFSSWSADVTDSDRSHGISIVAIYARIAGMYERDL